MTGQLIQPTPNLFMLQLTCYLVMTNKAELKKLFINLAGKLINFWHDFHLNLACSLYQMLATMSPVTLNLVENYYKSEIQVQIFLLLSFSIFNN